MSAPIVFRCPLCAGAFRVQPSPTPQQVRCSHCRGVVLVPAATTAEESMAIPAAITLEDLEAAAAKTMAPKLAATKEVKPGVAASQPAASTKAAERIAPAMTKATPDSRRAAENKTSDLAIASGSSRPAAAPGASLAKADSIPLDDEPLPFNEASPAVNDARKGATSTGNGSSIDGGSSTGDGPSATAPATVGKRRPTQSNSELLGELANDATTGEILPRRTAEQPRDEESDSLVVSPLPTPNAELSMQEVLAYGRSLWVSDIHVAAGAPVMFRMAKRLVPVTAESLTSAQAERLSLELLSEYQRGILRDRRDFDLMAVDEFGRYRVNVGYFDGELGTVIRILSQRPKSLADLRLPEIIRQFTYATKGLILITGSASQGKTTTLTGMIDEINGREARHIITIEDPIEYQHPKRKGLVRQRQIGMDTQDFSTGLRAALRQNPDVITIGEMRDYETIKIALTAAETGCLVISTLHILSIDKIIERLLSFAPAEDEGFIRYVLADTLVGVVHQELVPTIDGGKRVACEVLVCTPATRNIIRNRGTFFLRSVISTGRRYGMVPMQSSVQQLLEEGQITQETATNVMANYQ